MGGNASRAIAKKAIRPIKNINVEERAHKAVERHKTKPVPAPRHTSSKEKIEKHVADHPEIKVEIDKQDASLIDRVNMLQVDMVDNLPKIKSDRPLPRSGPALYSDPLLAFEEPRKIPKGTISFRQLQSILAQSSSDLKLHRAEVIVKEYDLNLQDTVNVLQYFENINLDELSGEETGVDTAKWEYDVNTDNSIKPKS